MPPATSTSHQDAEPGERAGRHAQLRRRRALPRDARRESAGGFRRARHVPRQRRHPRQRALAGRRYRWARLRLPGEQVDFARRSPSASARRRAPASRAQMMRQDNLPDYGLPAAASPIGPLSDTSVVAATPVDQTNYYGSPDYDYDHVSQDSVMLRLEHDVAPGLTLRNQTRYNTTTREAVITSIANPASFNPATNLVTLSRQANDRQNDILSNQTNLTARLSDGDAPARAQRRTGDSRAKINSHRRSRASARAPPSTSIGPTSSARSSAWTLSRPAPSPRAARTPSPSTRSTPSISARACGSTPASASRPTTRSRMR